MHTWLRDHSSSVFVSYLSLATLVLFFGGLFLTVRYAGDTSQAATLLRNAGVVLTNLSGMTFAGVIATIFFSFNDVQNYLAAAIATLFSQAGVVELLGAAAKDQLRRRLAEDSVQGTARGIDSSLFQHLEEVSRGSLGNAFVTNLSFTMTLSSLGGGMRRSHLVNTYRIHTPHLKTVMNFPLRVYREVSIPASLAEQFEKWFESAFITIGERSFTRADVKLASFPDSAGSIKLTASLEQVVELLSAETDVHIETTVIAADSDPSFGFFSRFASLGFSATVVGDDEHLYHAAWYLFCSPDQQTPAGGEVTLLPKGMVVKTNGWVLPGEGVVIIQARKPTAESLGTPQLRPDVLA